ncbi:hypothetical protein [Paraburkholderia sp. J63]|uniref:hypothetical protein n=1 Tax=Paraburkholderia sp. J63 TaxID=2805434 RepID=UPI002ABD6E82|nr:hypothetical protein [Paraburkholderia sp. J63]
MSLNAIRVGIIVAGIVSTSPGTVEASEYKIVGDNTSNIAAYREGKLDALTLLVTIRNEMARGDALVDSIPNGSGSSDIQVHGERMTQLVHQAVQKFGDGSAGPFSDCALLASAADDLWRDQIVALESASHKANTLDEILYREEVSACRSQITSEPKPTITVAGPQKSSELPAPGCSMLGSTHSNGAMPAIYWTCPKSAESMLH